MSALADNLQRMAEDEVYGLTNAEPEDALELSVVEEGIAADEVNSACSAVDAATDAAVSLESYVSQFMATCPRGEWNRATAQQYELGARALLKAHGVTVPSAMYTPSFESVERKSNKDEAEDAQFEEVKDKDGEKKSYSKTEHFDEAGSRTKKFLVRIYQAIKAAVQNFFKAIGNWIHTQRTRASALRAAADRIEGKAKELNGKRSKNMSTEDAKETVKISGGNYLTGGDREEVTPVKALGSLVSTARSVSHDWSSAYVHALNNAVSAVGSGKIGELAGDLSKIKRLSSGKMVGGWQIETRLAGQDPLDSMAKGKFEVKQTKEGGGGEVYVLNFSEVIGCCSAVRDAAKYIDDSTKEINKVQRDVDAAIKKVQANIDKANAGEESEIKKVANAISPIATRTTAAWRELNPMVGDFALKVIEHSRRSMVRWRLTDVKNDANKARREQYGL